MRAPAAMALLLVSVAPLAAQRGKETASDLFHSEVGLIVSPKASRSKFQTARKSTVSIMLGLRYRFWKVSGSQTTDLDPDGAALRPGDLLRLGLEINDTGYLYIVQRQASGAWRRVFPDPEIERGNHFIHSGVTYAIPPEEGLALQFPGGAERLLLVLSREPVKDLESLVSPSQAANTVSAAPPPEVSEATLAGVRKLLIPRDLLTEKVAEEKATYVVNRSGRPDSLIVHEIRLPGR
jgi:hypothetical protein